MPHDIWLIRCRSALFNIGAERGHTLMAMQQARDEAHRIAATARCNPAPNPAAQRN